MLPEIHQPDILHSGRYEVITPQGMLIYTIKDYENLLYHKITQPLGMGSMQPDYISFEKKKN